MKSENVRFFVIGDWGREGSPPQRSLAEAMARRADRYPLDFVVSAGDNFYEFGVTDVEDPLWERSFEHVYTHEALQVPWYAVLGNHDYVQNAHAQVDYSSLNNRWNMPARYFSKAFSLGSKRLQMLFLDTSPFISEYEYSGLFYKAREQATAPQLAWLEEALQEEADWRIVVGHHPLYSSGTIHGDQPDMIDAFQPLFDRYGVATYICGHEHDIQHIKPDGPTHHFLSGTGSEVRDTGYHQDLCFTASEHAFLEVVVQPDRLEAQFIGLGMNPLHQMSMRAPNARSVRA